MTHFILLSLFSGSLWQIVSETSGFGLFILLSLVIMSLISWSIIFNKWRQYRQVDYDTEQFLQHFNRSRKLSELTGQARQHPESPAARIYLAGYAELSDLKERKNVAGLQEKSSPLTKDDLEIIELEMDRSLNEQRAILEKRVVFLATTASSAPFMGLLGTVVGIMDSFWSIGERGSASLAVVAPGIAEALLATIVGLGAAIPAVIAYNWANNRVQRLTNEAYGFTLSFINRVRKEAI